MNTKEKKKLLARIYIIRKTLFKLLYNRGIIDLPITEKVAYYLKKLSKKEKIIQTIIDIRTEFKIALESKEKTKIQKWLDKYQDN